ncbi:Vms1/Ankzf1 family peptidyl-tRNA hydrolase [Actinomycetota bacterium Odt1-20B]
MDLAFLTALCERPGPWASVYVDTSQHSESTAEQRSVAAAGMQRALASAGADEGTCDAVRAAADGLKRTREPVGRALFAAQGEVVLDLPLSKVPTSSAQWASLPRMAPLLDLVGEDPLCLLACVDRTGADFALRSAREDREAGTVTGRQWPVHRTATADWSERHFQLRVENTWEHNADLIARSLADRQAETQADVVLLVGDDRECAAVQDRLPKDLQERAMRTRHGPGSRLLDEELERARAEHVAYCAAREMERYAEARGRQEGAAAGVPALVDAAREHRVAELLVRPDGADAHREVWVGDEPDQVAVRRTDAMALGAGEPASARADDALLRCAAASGAAALSVAAAAPETGPAGGLGALLRWTEPDR